MGDPGTSDTWKKMVITKANDQWISSSNIKQEYAEDMDPLKPGNISLDYRTESFPQSSNPNWEARSSSPESNYHAIRSKKERSESTEERASRLAKMSAYAAQRLANETADQRATRLKRMSEYAAKRLANETTDQRAKRLARMSAYAAKRLAQESPEQRQARLTRMSAYAAKRHAMKKMNETAIRKKSQRKNLMMDESESEDPFSLMNEKPNQN